MLIIELKRKVVKKEVMKGPHLSVGAGMGRHYGRWLLVAQAKTIFSK